MPGTICSRTPEHKRNVISFITRLRSLTPTVHLEREPGQGEKSHHHHQHLDDLELTIYIMTVVSVSVRQPYLLLVVHHHEVSL